MAGSKSDHNCVSAQPMRKVQLSNNMFFWMNVANRQHICIPQGGKLFDVTGLTVELQANFISCGVCVPSLWILLLNL